MPVMLYPICSPFSTTGASVTLGRADRRSSTTSAARNASTSNTPSLRLFWRTPPRIAAAITAGSIIGGGSFGASTTRAGALAGDGSGMIDSHPTSHPHSTSHPPVRRMHAR